MNLLIRLMLYLGAGAVLVAGNLWYLRSLLGEFSKSSPSIIAPFQIMGKTDQDGSLGMSLSHMLIARIGKIQQEMRASAQALEIAKGSIAFTNARPQDRVDIPLSIPNQIFEPLDIELTFRGVEVGGIISWLHNALTTANILKLSVHYSDDSATLIGTIATDSGSTIYLENLDLKNEQIVSAAAYTIAQKEFAKRFPEVTTLDRTNFSILLDSLHQAAQLKKQVALGKIAEDDYNRLLSKMEDLVNEIPRWKPLLRLAAEMAENASQTAKALQYYQMELDETDDKADSFRDLLSKIDALEDKLALEVGVATSLPKGQFEPNVLLKKLRDSDAGKKVLQQVGVSSFEMPNRPTIAILGGLPYENIVPNDQKTVLSSLTEAQDQDPFMTEYISTVVETVRLIAPDSNFIFQSIPSSIKGGFASSDMIKSINDLIDASPDILLITFGPLDSSLYEQIFKNAIEQDVLIVSAAGNRESNRQKAIYDRELLKKMMLVSAIDQSGQPASFTQKSESAFWAPGANIPVYIEQDEQVNFTTRNGTTYSAAIAAGIAARLLAQKSDLPVKALLEKLNNTSQKVVEPGPPVLNLEAALNSISQARLDNTKVWKNN